MLFRSLREHPEVMEEAERKVRENLGLIEKPENEAADEGKATDVEKMTGKAGRKAGKETLEGENS